MNLCRAGIAGFRGPSRPLGATKRPVLLHKIPNAEETQPQFPSFHDTYPMGSVWETAPPLDRRHDAFWGASSTVGATSTHYTLFHCFTPPPLTVVIEAKYLTSVLSRYPVRGMAVLLYMDRAASAPAYHAANLA